MLFEKFKKRDFVRDLKYTEMFLARFTEKCQKICLETCLYPNFDARSAKSNIFPVNNDRYR